VATIPPWGAKLLLKPQNIKRTLQHKFAAFEFFVPVLQGMLLNKEIRNTLETKGCPSTLDQVTKVDLLYFSTYSFRGTIGSLHIILTTLKVFYSRNREHTIILT